LLSCILPLRINLVKISRLYILVVDRLEEKFMEIIRQKEEKKSGYEIKFLSSAIAIISVFFAIFLFFWFIFLGDDLSPTALHIPNRIVNSIMAAVFMSMTLILTLASNLYTPRLVPIFIGHPAIKYPILFTIFTGIYIVVVGVVAETHPWYKEGIFVGYLLTCVLVGALPPFLSYVTFFIRPKFFMPLIYQNIKKDHIALCDGNYKRSIYVNMFDNISVISNISLTATIRDDLF